MCSAVDEKAGVLQMKVREKLFEECSESRYKLLDTIFDLWKESFQFSLPEEKELLEKTISLFIEVEELCQRGWT